MQTISKSLADNTWKALYLAALLEPDTTRLPERITAAERALAVRGRELFQLPGDNIEEEEAVDNALYSLNALRNVYRCGRSIEQPSAA
jgi:hypothetical protein